MQSVHRKVGQGPLRSALVVRWALLAAVVAGPGCGPSSAQLRRDEQAAAKKREDQERVAFLAEFDAAYAAKNWEKAAAAFTPQRHELLHRYTFAWGGNQEKLWRAVREAAEQAASRGALATSVVLCEGMEKAKLMPDVSREVAAAKAEYRRRFDTQLASWNKQLEPARADEAAGRPATAAMRLASLTGAPGKALLSQAQGPVCGLIAKAAQPHHLSVYVKAGKGDAALMQRVLAGVAAAAHGPAVTLLPQADGADVAITFDLGAEKLEKTSRAETRQGRYVSGQKAQPNPRIQSLQEDIARFEKEARWHEGKVASIRCNGSGKCSTESHRNSARSFREKLADAQKKLRSEPATKMGPVYSDISYDVQIQRTRLVQTVAFEVSFKDGQRESRKNDIDRWVETTDQPAVPQLGLAAKPAVPVQIDELRKELRELLVKAAPYVVHNNLERRNTAIVKAVSAANGAEKAELICTYLAANPLASTDSVAFANKELAALTSVQGGGTAMAQASQRCAAQAKAPAKRPAAGSGDKAAPVSPEPAPESAPQP